MDSSTLAQLVSPDGQKLLGLIPPYEEKQVLSLTARLREAGYSPELVAAALTQSRLRVKGEEKFGEFANNMVFTAAGLEQATRLSVAARHVQRLRKANSHHVIDLGCGIGADSLAFSGLGLRVTAIEQDPETAIAATANLHPFPEAAVIEADGRSVNLHGFGADAVWLDPARRTASGQRLKDPEEWQPKLSQALKLAHEFPAAGIKVAPGIAYEYLPEHAHVQWVSVNRELVEAVIWTGTAATTPGRSAVILKDGETITFEAEYGPPNVPIRAIKPRKLGPYLYEPDPAIIRAGGIERLADQLDLAPVSHGIAYLTGERVQSNLLSAFRVREVLPMDAKAVKKVLQRESIGQLEIKKRGTDVTPDDFRRKLGLKKRKGEAAVLILTPVAGRHRAILATRES
ncbi:class I SAM-dependent methyltransferase [Ancrocorticia sp.]|uniref:class I SAM-dependent methyltransferase n=1 Tax=Ancrocorticia sp. TaxID=2593684 RepID=UPI003F9280C1